MVRSGTRNLRKNLKNLIILMEMSQKHIPGFTGLLYSWAVKMAIEKKT